MKRALSTLILLVVALGLGAYIYFVESKRTPSSDTETATKSKVFTNVDGSKIDQLTVKASGNDTTLKKENGEWKIVAPITTNADDAAVSGITTNLEGLEVQRIVDEKPSDLTPFGLSPPKTSIAFRSAGESKDRTLLIGEKTPTGGDLYAKLEGEPRVFLVQGFLDNTFNRSTFDLRDKSILKLNREQVTGIEIDSPDRKLVFAKDGQAWRMTTPEATRTDFSTVDGLLSRVMTTPMKSLVADSTDKPAQYGLDKPSKQISFAAGSARSTLLLGSKSPDGSIYAKDVSRPLIFTVDASVADDMNKAPDDYRTKDLYDFRTFGGNRFEVQRNGGTMVFDKQKAANGAETWVQSQPKPAKQPAVGVIDEFLSKASNLRALSFVPALPQGATETLKTVARWGESNKEETVTYYKEGTDTYAVRQGEPGAAKMTTTDLDEAVKSLEAIK